MSDPHHKSIDSQVALEFLDEIHDQLDELLVRLSAYHTKNNGAPGAVLTMILVKFQGFMAQVEATKLPHIEKTIIELNRSFLKINHMGRGEVDFVINALEKLRHQVESAALAVSQPTAPAPAETPTQAASPLIPMLLICNERSLAKIIGREIKKFGFDVHYVQNLAELPDDIRQFKPKVIVCNATLNEASGVDIAQKLQADPATRLIPFALLTSFDPAHPMLAALPPQIPIIRKGEKFADDFTQALARFKL